MKTKYFVRRDPDGTPSVLYKSEWALGQLTAEFYYDTAAGDWAPSKDISYWNHFGDVEIEEIDAAQAALLLV